MEQDKRTKSIIKQSCLKCASAIITTGGEISTGSIEALSEKVIKLAERFVSWVEE